MRLPSRLEKTVDRLCGILHVGVTHAGGLQNSTPDHASVAAAALAVTAGGGARIKTIVLLTPEEVDQAARKTVEFRPAGQ